MRSWNLPPPNNNNYRIIIINVYYNYIINAWYSYYISNKVLLQECDIEVNMSVTGGCFCFLLERRL